MIDLTNVLNAMIALLAALISTFIIPWIRSKTSAAQREEWLMWIDIAVAAAEQIYKGSGRGVEKKAYVLRFLNDKGYNVNDAALDAAVEAAVKHLTTQFA